MRGAWNDQSKMTHFAGGASPSVSASTSPASSSPATSSASPAAAAGAPPAVASAPGQPDLKSAKIDFIPGERTVFYDDISDMAEDEPPPHWKVRGDSVELRTGGGIHQLTITGHSQLTSAAIVFPENFTFEVDEVFSPKTTTWPSADWNFRTKDGNTVATLGTVGHLQDHILAFQAGDSTGHLGGRRFPEYRFHSTSACSSLGTE